MKFKFVLKVNKPVNCYTGKQIMTGDIVELNDHFSEKALNNPNYEFVKPDECKIEKEVIKKKTKKKSKKKVTKRGN